MSNPLWDYALATYRRDEVAAACLLLQDSFDLDVNLLLYAAWLARQNRCLGEVHLTELDALVTEWREQVVKPLRALRRQLRTIPRATGVREALKALELRAEQEQQDVMYAYYQRAVELPRADNPLPENLMRVALLSSPGNRGWESAIRRLASLIPQ